MKSLTFQTKLYLYLTYAAGAVIFAWHIMKVDLSDPILLASLCVLASLALILKVEGSTNRSHYTFSFLVYGFAFAVFGTSEAILVIVVSNIAEWIWNKTTWYIPLFNMGCYIIVMQAAGLVYHWINPFDVKNTWEIALAIVASMATFNFLNHLMVGIIVMFARGESLKESGVFEFFSLMLDLTLLYFGASLSFVWNYNPFALGLFIIPLYLIYSTLRVPALERKTELDPKTGLFNHEYFKKQVFNELARANRFDRPMSIILADLDLLRNINNTYGHLAGDQVLIGMANAIKQSVREYDVVCRFGGEEFAILLPETTLSLAYERAEIIRRAIEALEFTVPTSVTPIRATMSFGIAQRENFSQTPDDITHNADLALYHSKLKGRNRSYAYIDETYVDFQMDNPENHSGKISHLAPAKANVDSIVHTSEPFLIPVPAAPKTESVPATASVKEAETTAEPKEKPQKTSHLSVKLFIGLLALAALVSIMALWKWTSLIGNSTPLDAMDWLGLVVLSALVVMSEGFSVDLYVRNSSVSTSAIPILVAYLIFGPAGILCVSLVLAVTLLAKYRSPINRFIFNFSNHLLAGSLSLGMVLLTGTNFLDLHPLYQVLLSLAASTVLYTITTSMISYGISLELQQPAFLVWKEQYSWLAPYYAGIGFIAYAMIFGYKYDHITGLLIMVIPMVLLRISQKQYIDRTRQVVKELRENNQTLKKHSEEINEINEGLLITLSEIIDLRDPYVLGHSKQVSKYASKIAKIMGLKEKQIEVIRKAGLLHDIGKLGIAMEILTKPSKLTNDEYEIIKGHAALGGDLVKNSPSLRPIAAIIRHHHEYYNGEGYPDKLKGNQISIESRIISVADAIEAMTSDRPYRRGLKKEVILEELKRYSGTQFDPLVVEAAIEMLNTISPSETMISLKTDAQLQVARQFSEQMMV